ncbi:MAG: hypothetical protein JNJ54_08295 [Myxococcaceae bacterium]|nr:hypothetical protein [Myxococcaceae bacterium]
MRLVTKADERSHAKADALEPPPKALGHRARPPRGDEGPELTPHALFPGAPWRSLPLRRQEALWVLEHRGVVLRWQERDGSLYERLATGEVLANPVRWHERPQRGKHASTLPDDFLLLPGPSAFLAGERLLPAGPLSGGLVAVFADALAMHGDVAAPLLNAAAAGDEPSVRTLWSPYASTAGAIVRPAFEGSHCGGFFEEVVIRAWRGMERDLPVLAAHPMLQRLRKLTLVVAPETPSARWPPPIDVAQLREAAASLPRPLEVVIA